MRVDVKQEAAAIKAERIARAEQIRALPKAERAQAKKAWAGEQKAAKKARKAEIKALPRKERRQAKRFDKKVRKVLNRRRRLIGWSIFAAFIIAVGIGAAPYVRDINTILSIHVDSDSAEAEAARDHGETVAHAISDEGIVLLKNEDVLPLATDQVNVFGFDSFNMRFGGGGSGSADQSRSVGFYEGLTGAGIEYNPELHALLKSEGADDAAGASSGVGQIVDMVLGKEAPKDPDPTYLTDEVMGQAASFSPVALVVFGNDGVEMKDFTPEELTLTDEQVELLDRVTGTFDDVIVVVNSGNTMELGFIDNYSEIKGAISVATAGPKAAVSLADILTGAVNPSARTTDTVAYASLSAPASENFGDYKYDNYNRAFLDYAESIYVGYRFYETFYEGDEDGYEMAVQFPFGYGLSYTTFDWDVTEPVIKDGEVTVEVAVTNLGDVAGKDVVQVYLRPPYIPGGLEKSAVELAGYAKTSLLEPGESETVQVQFALRDLASWDEAAGGVWVLDEGEYTIDVSTDVHSPVASSTFVLDKKQVFDTDDVTGAALSNQFADVHGDVTYLSRNDWEGTYPNPGDVDYTAPPAVVEAMEASPLPAEDLPEGPTTGAENGIMLEQLRGLPYDDPLWDQFLDQFTVDEMKTLFSDAAYHTVEISRLGVPGAVLLDGPAGISFFFGDVKAASYPTAVVVASTWNDDLALQLGEAAAEEAKALGVTVWYAPGMNLHRTALGGRNFEYYSEDPLLSGKMGANVVRGAESHGVVTTMKHFLLNDQETNARSGINIWANEQSLRELYLKPFEITVKEGDPTGAMSSFIHLGTDWSGANVPLLDNVLRDEWGFEGVVSTDAVLGSFMDIQAAALHGSDLMLDPVPARFAGKLDVAYKKAPNAVTWGLRDHAHNWSYALVNSWRFE